MTASAHIGRIGALAAALGVGAAVLTGTATAWADRGTSDSAGPSSSDSADANASTPPESAPAPVRGARAPRNQTPDGAAPATPKISRSAVDTAVDATPEPAAATVPDVAQRASDSVFTPADQIPAAGPDQSGTATTSSESDEPAHAVDTEPGDAAEPAPAATLVTVAPAVQPAASLVNSVPVVARSAALLPAKATVADRISTAVTSFVAQLADTFGHSPFAPPAESPAAWALLAAARRQPAAAATATAPTAAATTAVSTGPTLLVLNGYNVVPSSVQTVVSFTGRWSYWPGNPNMVQGRQEFNLVDPKTQAKVGGFSALVTSGDPTSTGFASYSQLLVTANDGTNVGPGAGQIPPVGSIISALSLGGLFGLSYSAMPTASGDKVSAKIVTPFGNIALPIKYDAAEGIADQTFDNRQIALGGGFSMKPVNPEAEEIIATIGLLPAFNSVQGRQTFGIYDSDGKSVGTFKGEFTTTSDVIGINTQAILVTANDGINVGTGAGQTPPVGTVYNVAYFGSEKVALLYSSKPKPTGTDISITLTTPNGVTNIPKELFNSFNASKEPPMKALSAPGGQRFVATSALLPAGVNGLPPRDVQIQGYQQFEVRDLLGKKIGSVDADVQSQWDGYGIHSTSLLITNVTSGPAGTLPFNVPPVGTVMNFVYFTGGFGFADVVYPEKGLTVNAWKLITPTGDIPLLPLPLPVTNRPKVDYFNPFVV